MTGSIISGTITTGVTLGSGGILSPLTITPTGRVDDAGFHYPSGLVALYVPSAVDATIANYGTVAGSGTLGTGAVFAGSGDLLNHGAVSGHLGGTGIALGAAALLTNFSGGTIMGGAGDGDGSGGTGVVLDGGTLDNSGAISGGRDARATFDFGPAGVSGRGSIVNNGQISGGYDSYRGGPGVDLTGPAALVNHGVIASATGGIGSGGFGIILGAGDIVMNTGTIAGGSGGYINGGTLLNAGTIIGKNSDAVFFGANAATLVVEPGAVFIGQVVARTAAHDVLVAAGTFATPLAGIGTAFQNFSSIEFAPHAQGTIEGNIAGLAHGQTISGFQHHDTIVLDGFTATRGTYAAGAGVELSNGAQTVTLDITGAFNPNELRGSSSDAGTTISLADTAPITLGTDLSSFTFVSVAPAQPAQFTLSTAGFNASEIIANQVPATTSASLLTALLKTNPGFSGTVALLDMRHAGSPIPFTHNNAAAANGLF